MIKFLAALLLALTIPARADFVQNIYLCCGSNNIPLMGGSNNIVIQAGDNVSVVSNYANGVITFTISAQAEITDADFDSISFTNNRNRRLVVFGDSFLEVGLKNLWVTNVPFFGQGTVTNVAHSGDYTYDVEAMVSNNIPLFTKTKASDEIFVIVDGGGNNLSHFLNNVTQMINNMSNAYCMITNAGAQLMIVNITPSIGSYPPTEEANRLIFNGWTRSNHLAYGAALLDVAKMFPNPGDTSIFYDGNHPTTNAGNIMALEAARLFQTQGRGLFTVPGTNNSYFWFGSGKNVPIFIGPGGQTNITLNPDRTTKIFGAAFNGDGSVSVDSDIHIKNTNNRLQFDGHGWNTLLNGMLAVFNVSGGRGSLKHGTNTFDGFNAFTPPNPTTWTGYIPVTNGAGQLKLIPYVDP